MTKSDIWGEHDIGFNTCLHWQVGPLDLWVRRTPMEWQIASSRSPDEEDRSIVAEPVEPPADLEWRRWAAKEDETRILLRPVFPDRPVIIRPEAPLVIPKNHDALFYVRVPLSVEVQAGAKTTESLGKEPSVVLTNTWFGTPVDGELCYGLRIRATRDIDAITFRPHRAICPIQIRNLSDAPLDFQRLCLRVKYLGVYRGQQHLWTNMCRLSFRGEEVLGRVIYGKGAPDIDAPQTPLSPPGESADRGLLARSFDNLKQLADVFT